MARARPVQLPDCSGAARDAFFALSADLKRELVRRIAEDGPGAIDAFIKEKEAEGDSFVARMIQRARDELTRRAEEMRAMLDREYDADARALATRYDEAFAELDAKRRDAESQLSRLRTGDIGDALRDAEVVNLVLSAPPPKPSAWQRVKRVLLKVLAFILWPLRALLGLLFPDRSGRKPHDKRVTFATPVAGSVGAEIEAKAAGAYVTNPQFRRRVNERLRAAPPRERVRRAWQRLLGREDYESIVRAVARDMLEEEAEKKRSEREQRLAEDLSRLTEEEEQRRAEREGAVERLRKAREEEARRIEEEVAKAPERDVKEALVSELKATGLLRERAGRLVPTMQFMDRFAALVYEEETRSLASGGGRSAGAYAEGEGTYVREPLRTAIETGHMDVVATLVRARTRHPHVRHVTDDDVLVYREEREAREHVVVILDRSGSMEENDRMTAAKRAALALAHAVKQDHPRNRVDFIIMDTSVNRADEMGVWDAEPRGFTNTGGALRLARRMLEDARSERGLVYLVTDGLPEAYTEDGEDVAGHPEKARQYAVREARQLKRTPGFGRFVCLLLEPDEPMFVEAAEEIADVLDGHVVKLAPQELASTLIREHQSVA